MRPRSVLLALSLVATASFLATLTFVRARPAVGFLARSVARHFEREGQVRTLPVALELELPPVGLITPRGRRLTPGTERLLACLREVAARIRRSDGRA